MMLIAGDNVCNHSPPAGGAVPRLAFFCHPCDMFRIDRDLGLYNVPGREAGDMRAWRFGVVSEMVRYNVLEFVCALEIRGVRQTAHTHAANEINIGTHNNTYFYKETLQR